MFHRLAGFFTRLKFSAFRARGMKMMITCDTPFQSSSCIRLFISCPLMARNPSIKYKGFTSYRWKTRWSPLPPPPPPKKNIIISKHRKDLEKSQCSRYCLLKCVFSLHDGVKSGFYSEPKHMEKSGVEISHDNCLTGHSFANLCFRTLGNW